MSWHKWVMEVPYLGNTPHPDKDGGKETSVRLEPERIRLGPILTVRMRLKIITCRVVRGHVRAG